MRLRETDGALVVTVEQECTVDMEMVDLVVYLLEEAAMFRFEGDTREYAMQTIGEAVEEAMQDEYSYRLWWSNEDGVGYFHVDDEDEARKQGYIVPINVRID